MTKKELLENDIFKMVPDDAELVFSTDKEAKRCVRITPLNLSLIVEGERKFLVVDSIPYWYLKERYNITLNETTL